MNPKQGDDLRYGGISIAPGDTIKVIEHDDDSIRSAILTGKCYAVSYCDASGVDRTSNYVYYEGFGNPYDLILEAIESPKWMSVSVTWMKPKLAASASDFFKPFEPNPDVQCFVRRHIDTRYWEDYDGAYVNSSGSYSGMLKLRDKMRGRLNCGKIQTGHDIPAHVLQAIKFIFLEKSGLHQANIPIVLDEHSVAYNSFRSSAALGGAPYDIPNSGTKGNWLDIHKENMHWIIQQLLAGKLPEEIMSPWYHVMAAKAEVRSKDVPPEKVRVIFQQFMEADAVGEFLSKPLTEWFRHHDWYLPGTSMMGNHYPKLLRSLKHPDAKRFWPEFPTFSVPLMYLALDQTSQDWNYIPELLAFLLFLRFLFFDPSDRSQREFFVKLFGWELTWVFCKLIQLWGGTWWFLFGAFCSGSKWTTWADTCQSFLVWMITVWCLFGSLFTLHLTNMGFCFYGDDTSVSMAYDPLIAADLLDRVISAAQRVGCVYKRDGSDLLTPEPFHKDRFYTHVTRDGTREYVISHGLKMLQRQFVKVDKKLNFLHPDSEEFFTALPWRPTVDYVVKLGLDPNNWKDSSGPWVQWYRKAFGLLIDSAANKEAHDMIKAAMAEVRDVFPEQVKCACSGYEWANTDLAIKLGELDPNLIYKLPLMPNSYRIICGMYIPKPHKIVDLKPSVRNVPLPFVYANRP